MQWTEEAIILSSRKFGEANLLVEVFARSKGLCSALVRGGQSRKQSPTYQPGNIVEITWRGRLEEQLGMFTGENINPIASKVIAEPVKLQALISLTSILRKTLIDRQPYIELYEYTHEFLRNFTREGEWLENYIWIELALLRYLGFGLDLNSCAVTGRFEGLKYISPRTGRAVTEEGAKGYEDRLFNLPAFMVENVTYSPADILAALEITEYFISKNLFAPHQRKLPEERARFIQVLAKQLKTAENGQKLAI